jgi:hypothetical protein
MAVSGADGALMKVLCLMGWGSRNSLGRGAKSFLVLVLRWAIAPRLVLARCLVWGMTL